MQIHYKPRAFVILYNLLLFNSGYFVVFIVHIQQMLYTFMQPTPAFTYYSAYY